MTEDEAPICTKCDTKMDRIHINVENNGAVLLWCESLNNIELYVCPKCRRVEAVEYDPAYSY